MSVFVPVNEAAAGGGGGLTLADFDATDYGTVRAWYDARHVNGVGNAQPSDNDAVAQWNDLSGNGYHLVQATAARKPTFRDGVGDNPTDQPFVAFDATFPNEDFMKNTAAPSFSQPITVYACVDLQGYLSGSVFLELASASGTTVQVGLGSNGRLNTYAGTGVDGHYDPRWGTFAFGITINGSSTKQTMAVKGGGPDGSDLTTDVTINPGTGGTGTGFTLGAERTTFAGLFFQGRVMALAVYAEGHNDATRHAATETLLQTWTGA